MQTLQLFFLLFLIIQSTFASEALTNIFTGYQQWKEAEPFIYAEFSEIDSAPIQIKIILHCPHAYEFKISNHPDFRGAAWQKMTPDIKWYPDNTRRVVTIYAVFKSPKTKNAHPRISKIVNYSYDINYLYRSIQRFDDIGYIDWTEGVVYIYAQAVHKAGGNERYTIDKAQAQAEGLLYANGFSIVKHINVNFFYTISGLCEFNPALYQQLNLFLRNISVNEIKFIDRNTVLVEGTLPLSGISGNNKVNNLNFLIPPLGEIPAAESPDIYETVFEQIIVDVRGLNFSPCLFPQIYTIKQEPVLTAAMFTNTSGLYVRYIRNLAENNILLHNKKRTLFIKALELVSDDRTKLVITDRNKQLIHANKKTIDNLSGGNFIILLE